MLGIETNADEQEIRKAHRELARRWHPDRFPEGPERLWAESKMVMINIAFEDALGLCSKEAKGVYGADQEQFSDVRRLMELNQLSAARQALMRIASRTAEWNYLFGAVLFRLGEVEKSSLYFGIATRQRPGNQQYQTAYMSAQAVKGSDPRFNRMKNLFQRRNGR